MSGLFINFLNENFYIETYATYKLCPFKNNEEFFAGHVDLHEFSSLPPFPTSPVPPIFAGMENTTKIGFFSAIYPPTMMLFFNVSHLTMSVL